MTVKFELERLERWLAQLEARVKKLEEALYGRR
jgi:hypothetical protein